MKLVVEKEVFKKFSRLNIGVVVIKGMDNKRDGSDVVRKMLDEISTYCRDTYVLKGFSKSPYITNWKKAYGKSVGYHTAVENIMHDVLLGKDVPHRNNLVDLYRYFMLKQLIPIGGDDFDKLKGDVRFKIAEGWETLKPEHMKLEHPKPGELIVVDDSRVLARRWSWHESKDTKITHYTKNAVLYFDGLSPVTYQVLERAIKEFVDVAKSFVGGRVKYKILNFVNPSMRL
ncbi:hypothetical protein KY337_01105 [Candidatus Woesearchaeota archaeon]|nr:hypothetical protein [Candidatus Woesearchaeota archaeon]